MLPLYQGETEARGSMRGLDSCAHGSWGHRLVPTAWSGRGSVVPPSGHKHQASWFTRVPPSCEPYHLILGCRLRVSCLLPMTTCSMTAGLTGGQTTRPGSGT